MRADLIERLRAAAESYEYPPSIQSQQNIRAINAMREAADALASQEPAYWTVLTSSGRPLGLWPDKAAADEVSGQLSLGGTPAPLFASPVVPVDAKGEARGKIAGAIRGLERIKADFKMVGTNAVTIERAIQTLRFAAPTCEGEGTP